jgi:hypothetical protein
MINKYIGRHCVFRIGKITASGYFCGIAEYQNNYGMVFVNVDVCGIDVPESICIMIDPKKIKCTMADNIINLRKECRKIFDKNNLPTGDNIFHPLCEINEVSFERVS